MRSERLQPYCGARCSPGLWIRKGDKLVGCGDLPRRPSERRGRRRRKKGLCGGPRVGGQRALTPEFAALVCRLPNDVMFAPESWGLRFS